MQEQGWVTAINLRKGDTIETMDGFVHITKVERTRHEEAVAVYNFHVKDWVSYFVGTAMVYVHNSPGEHIEGLEYKSGSYSPKNKTSLWGQEKYVTEKGLNTIKQHLSGDLADEFNDAMINRLDTAFNNNIKISGADLDFYAHEIYEANLMKKGMGYDYAHEAAKAHYNAKEFNFYHPEVIKQNSKLFNNAWFKFWGIERN